MSPHNKDTRQVCFENCKKILGGLLPVYPMITFHQNSQRLAVGASDGKVFIYDITTGSIWKNLNAHSNEISALSFDFTGNVLISYSSAESTLKFWKVKLLYLYVDWADWIPHKHFWNEGRLLQNKEVCCSDFGNKARRKT